MTKTPQEQVDDLEAGYLELENLLAKSRTYIDAAIRTLEPERVCRGCGEIRDRGGDMGFCRAALTNTDVTYREAVGKITGEFIPAIQVHEDLYIQRED